MSHSSGKYWRGKRVTVMGLGRFGGGVGATRWLVRQAAEVTVSDQAGAEELAESVTALEGLDVKLHLGGHRESDIVDCDVLVVNPGVPFDSPYLAIAREAGIELTTEINLFLARCPAPVVGITGSAGKSTTTAMTGAILARRKPTHVGGNIGVSLLEKLEESPHVAVVTNLHPNHLDRHRSMSEYAEAKKNIFRFQGPDDVLILNADNEVARWGNEAPGQVCLFSADAERFDLPIPGKHNQANAQAAWVAAQRFGASRQDAEEALRGFAGLPHRLELVCRRGEVSYFNDSKSTAPTEAISALESFPVRSVIAIVGGYDKHVDLSELCAVIARRAKAVVATGQTGAKLARSIGRASTGTKGPQIIEAPMFEDAVKAARNLAGPGDVVLLSPGCASFDQFDNYERRGNAFRRLVQEGQCR